MKWNDYKLSKPDISKLKKKENKFVSCLVQLEDGDIMLATFHPNIIIVGGQFEFDRSPIQYWVYLNDILKEIEYE